MPPLFPFVCSMRDQAMSTEESKPEGLMEFTLDRVEIPIHLKLGTETQKFVLKDLVGRDRDGYVTGLLTRSKDNGNMKDVNGLQASLLCRCLYNDKGALVSSEIVQQWPAKVVQALFDKAKEISGLKKDAEDTAKND